MIKDEYKNLPDEEFVPLDCDFIDPIYRKLYKINKLGEVLTIATGKIRKPKMRNGNLYPSIMLSNKGIKGGNCKNYYVHLLVAHTFLVKPKGTTEVDHINSITSDTRASNLNWVTRKQNMSKTDRSESTFNKNYKKYDKEGNFVGLVSFRDLTKEDKIKISKSITNKTMIDGFSYKLGLTDDLYEYLEYLGMKEKDLDKLNFVEASMIDNPNALVSDVGIFKINGRYTIGGKRPGGYRTITIGKSKTYSSHRVIYSTFSGETLTEDDVIDHINTNPADNRFSNLRKTDFSGNMNNPITISKKLKPILKYTLDGVLLKEYSSGKEVLSELGISKDNSLKRCCLGTRFTWRGFIWVYKENANTELPRRLEKLKKDRNILAQVNKEEDIEVYNSVTGDLIKTFKDRESASSFLGITKLYLGYVLYHKESLGTLISGKYLAFLKRDKSLVSNYIRPEVTKEDCKKEAKKYSSRTKFLKGSVKYWKISNEKGWLDDFFPLGIPTKVKQFSLKGEFIKTYKSASSAEKELGIRNVSRVCNGSGNVSGGYLWCYEEQEDTIPDKVAKLNKNKGPN